MPKSSYLGITGITWGTFNISWGTTHWHRTGCNLLSLITPYHRSITSVHDTLVRIMISMILQNVICLSAPLKCLHFLAVQTTYKALTTFIYLWTPNIHIYIIPHLHLSQFNPSMYSCLFWWKAITPTNIFLFISINHHFSANSHIRILCLLSPTFPH